MLRTLIVDDEGPARQRLVKLLRPFEEEDRLKIVGTAVDGYEALAIMDEQQVDVLLLDIQMPELDGFDVIERIESTDRPMVVFITAYDQYAVRAFEANAVDYLLKPVSRQRLQTAIDRAEIMHGDPAARQINAERLDQLIQWIDTQRVSPDEDYARQLSIPFRDRILIVPVPQIISAEINEGITRIFALEETNDRERLRQHVVNHTLDQLESNLDPRHFMRVHRSAIVQIDHINEMISWHSGRYKLVLTGDHEVIASRERSKTLRDRLALE